MRKVCNKINREAKKTKKEEKSNAIKKVWRVGIEYKNEKRDQRMKKDERNKSNNKIK